MTRQRSPTPGRTSDVAGPSASIGVKGYAISMPRHNQLRSSLTIVQALTPRSPASRWLYTSAPIPPFCDRPRLTVVTYSRADNSFSLAHEVYGKEITSGLTVDSARSIVAFDLKRCNMRLQSWRSNLMISDYDPATIKEFVERLQGSRHVGAVVRKLTRAWY